MKTTKLFQRVQKNVHTIPNNKRDIDIPLETIIVIGYTKGQQIRNEEPNINSFVMMGKFIADDSDWDRIDLLDTIVLDTYNVNPSPHNDELLFATKGEDYIETADWWRIPTDDEMKLYCHFFNKNSPINRIRNLIAQCKNDKTHSVLEELEEIYKLLKREIE